MSMHEGRTCADRQTIIVPCIFGTLFKGQNNPLRLEDSLLQ